MYVDAWYDSRMDQVVVAERLRPAGCGPAGRRRIRDFPADHTIWVEDEEAGSHLSPWGTRVRAVEADNARDAQRIRKLLGGRREFEADVGPVLRCLEQEYADAPTPTLNVALFDIEVDVDRERGFAAPEDPHAPVNCIGVHLSWTDSHYTLFLPPPGASAERIEEESGLSGLVVCPDEETLLRLFVEEILQDADLISGWNSSGYDVPYLINRMRRIGLDDLPAKMCLGNVQPRERIVERFGRQQSTYELVGRVHIDYLELYRKNKARQFHTFRLDHIGAVETGERKIPYEGNLGDLWRSDPVRFVRYNRQDVNLLVGIDRRCRFLDLANAVAHANRVPLRNTLGTVVLVEQAVGIEYHRRRMVVPTRGDVLDLGDGTTGEDRAVAGAWVVSPKKGVHEWIGCVDIQSLYPSTIRSLNISPETLIGQIDTSGTLRRVKEAMDGGASAADAFHDVFLVDELRTILEGADDAEVVVWARPFGHWLRAGRNVLTASEVRRMILDPEVPICASANGTLFRTDVVGVIPDLLGRWFAERKRMQALAAVWSDLADGIALDADAAEAVATRLGTARNDIPEEELVGLRRSLEDRDWETLAGIVRSHGLTIADGRIAAERNRAEERSRYWNERQHIRKILLNSVYGALLNPNCRFFDPRLGQSVTLTGRCITRHMTATINRILTGVADPMGDAIVYGDTDSAYFSVATARTRGARITESYDRPLDRDSAVELYDRLTQELNTTFADFLASTFGVPQERCVIRAGRELVGERGYFVKKKRYAVSYYDKEGRRLEKPRTKVMGFESRRSDTPEPVQRFLERVLDLVLSGHDATRLRQEIESFRQEFRSWKPWEQGTPRAVNGLSEWTRKARRASGVRSSADRVRMLAKTKGLALPGHVRAAVNWNILRECHGDRASIEIRDGMKVVVCRLRPNTLGIGSIAFPTDQEFVPEWFAALPFDTARMEHDMIDRKVENLLAEFGLDEAPVADEDAFIVFD